MSTILFHRFSCRAKLNIKKVLRFPSFYVITLRLLTSFFRILSPFLFFFCSSLFLCIVCFFLLCAFPLVIFSVFVVSAVFFSIENRDFLHENGNSRCAAMFVAVFTLTLNVKRNGNSCNINTKGRNIIVCSVANVLASDNYHCVVIWCFGDRQEIDVTIVRESCGV